MSACACADRRAAPRPRPPQRPSTAGPQQKLQQAGSGVIQLYRYPGLTQSKAKTLLRKVRAAWGSRRERRVPQAARQVAPGAGKEDELKAHPARR